MSLLNKFNPYINHHIYQYFLRLNNITDQIFTVFFVEKLTVSKEHFLLYLQIGPMLVD